MLDDQLLNISMFGALALSLFFRCLLWIYYSDGDRILPLLKLAAPTSTKTVYYKRFDTVLAPLSFLYCWLDIVAAVLFFRWTGFHPLAGLLLVILAAGRMRALQEIGHNALHAALCPSKHYQWMLSNIFFQFPMLKRDMNSRFITHVKEHHPNADVPGKDPNLKRVINAGMVPGIKSYEFIRALLFPVSPKGLLGNLKGNCRDVIHENASSKIIILRAVVMAAMICLFIWLGGIPALLFGWFIPAISIYPLFSWWSLLSKHRWHTPYVPGLGRREHDYEHGRATDFPGLSGAVQRYMIFPMSDAYHLAHHIFPFVRSEYMPAVDRALKVHEPRYTQYISSGMIFARHGQPAALSELYHRLVRKNSVEYKSIKQE